MRSLEWRRCHILLVIYLLLYLREVHAQNSIKPRRTKAEQVLSCPDVSSQPESPCHLSCTQDDHCQNHGEMWCCPSAQGSPCRAECMLPVESHSINGVCFDFERGVQYSQGDVFMQGKKCCKCQEGGHINCRKLKTCVSGCYYGGAYYNDGEAMPKTACRNCSCHNGEVLCSWNTNCTQEKCKFKGKVYKLEDMVSINGCKQCVCHYTGWHCTELTCQESRMRSKAEGVIWQPCLLSLVFLVQYLLQCRFPQSLGTSLNQDSTE
ncbi:kielin/chordin-like protein [Nematostella vectensis]|uniref:kielin/chordin-like protein n=1 Tax=Nematostella vectensis TaxID=45351 RepID=UPI0020771E8A|nr:kielin/chordin-like protein [Nematostella vectensis]